jgi:hypothetical protein
MLYPMQQDGVLMASVRLSLTSMEPTTPTAWALLALTAALSPPIPLVGETPPTLPVQGTWGTWGTVAPGAEASEASEVVLAGPVIPVGPLVWVVVVHRPDRVPLDRRVLAAEVWAAASVVQAIRAALLVWVAVPVVAVREVVGWVAV